MTVRTGPRGMSTCGRVGLLKNCAAAGVAVAKATAANSHQFSFIARSPLLTARRSQHLEVREIARARADLVLLDPVQVQDAQKHVRGPLRVVGKNRMAIALERPVAAADEDDRHLP